MIDLDRTGTRSGLEYLATMTQLLQRNRLADPHHGLFEAAELQWWWAQFPRVTDDFEQRFWFDDEGPVAAALVTDWRGEAQLDPLVLPDADRDDWVEVMRCGLAHAAAGGFERVNLEVSRDNQPLRDFLLANGFVIDDDGLAESWLTPGDRPPISELAAGYSLRARDETADLPHPMKNERRGHIDSEPRLRQTSLYRPDLDLAVYAADGSVAAYGLFWYDDVTGVGVVEPMRTEDAHQQRGLARHVLTTGIDRLAGAGAERIKICFEPGNPAAKGLYLDVGFRIHRANDLFAGPTS